jgi:hypothetical protein
MRLERKGCIGRRGCERHVPAHWFARTQIVGLGQLGPAEGRTLGRRQSDPIRGGTPVRRIEPLELA